MKPVSPSASAFSMPVEPDVATPEPTEEDSSGNERAPERPRRPSVVVVTYTLLAVNILFWFLTVAIARPVSLSEWWGVAPDTEGTLVLLALGAKINAAIQQGEYWRLIMPIFLHGGFMHLAGNCLMLLLLGSAVERIYGPGRFFVLYFFSGILGNIASYEFSPATGVGASGAIMGLGGVLIVFTMRHRHAISPRFRDEVRKVLVPLVLIQLALGLGWQSVDTMAHLGGLLGGCLLAMLVETPLGGPFALARERLPVGTALVTALLLLGYTGVSAAANVQRKLPSILARGPGHWEPALEHYRGVLKRNPDLPDERLQYAQTLEEAGQWAEAAKQYQEYLDRGGDLLGVRQRLAVALLQSGQATRAVNVLEQLVRREPDQWRTKALLAVALVAADRAREGVQLYDELLRLHPNETELQQGLVEALLQSDQSARAISVIEALLRREPNDFQFKAMLAMALVEADRTTEGVRQYKELLRQRPNEPQILNGLAYAYADELKTNIPEAIEMARRAVELRPSAGAYWDTLGWAYYRGGKLQEAANAQERAVQLAGALAEVHYHLGVIYEAQGRRDAALAEYRAALQRDPKFEAARTAMQKLEGRPGS